jgi:hypothetical protein
MAFPTRSEVELVLVALVEGRVSAQEADSWTAPFVVDESTHPDEIDAAVWDTLNKLCGADLEQAPGAPLHGSEDFANWLTQFRARTSSSPICGMSGRTPISVDAAI